MTDRVLAAATELGYRPNVLARSMITGKSRLIGLVVAYLDNQFYPEILEKMSTSLQQRGYHVLVFMAQQTSGNVDSVLQEIMDYQVDGSFWPRWRCHRSLPNDAMPQAFRWCFSTGRSRMTASPQSHRTIRRWPRAG